MTVEAAAAELGADAASGLSGREAQDRLRRYGPNRLRRTEAVRWWQVLAGQLKSVVVLLLAVAAVVAFAFGDSLEGLSIVVVILLNTGIGFVTEFRASRAMEALQKLGAADSVALRDGERRTLPATELVPGDVLVLQEGESVTADCRVVESAGLLVDEASLTGESLPVDKSTEPCGDEDLALADRADMVYKGTYVAEGNGVALVVATGAATEIGRIGELVSGIEEEKTPLEKRLDRLGRRLIVICLAVAAVVLGSGLLQGVHFIQMLEASIALAIAAVPEGLPAVATITLAVGMRRMARRNALIRRLPAVETLGSATCVCTDKTGTLTRGEMVLTQVRVPGRTVEVSGVGNRPEGAFTEDGRELDAAADPQLRPLLVVSCLCNNASLTQDAEEEWTVTGDPTEGALVVGARKAGLSADDLREAHAERREFPFASRAMLMGTVNAGLGADLRPGDGLALCVKGAAQAVVGRCTRILTADGVEALDDAARERILERNEQMAADGLRVLACAFRPLDAVPGEAEDAYADLVYLGLVGIMDPPREEARETVETLTRAGIKTVMITGDQPATAAKIAGELTLAPVDAPVLTGRDLVDMDEDELAERLSDVEVFARTSPEQKVDILAALQRRGEICAMLGDGVNDAIALKRADIGVAMGMRGTDVAKETADMLLLDDRFATVAAAVHQGRIIYSNIRKFIHYLFSCNLSEMLTMLVASLLGQPLPLLPLQILWLNLITDVFPALALALEPGERDVMGHPPRAPEAPLLDRPTVRSIGGYGALITLATIAAFLYGRYVRGYGADGGPDPAVTMSFLTIAFAQLLHVFNSRKESKPMRWEDWLSNRYVLGAVALTVGLQLAAVYAPGLSTVLKTSRPGVLDWLVVAACSCMPLCVGQLWRRVRAGGA